MAFSEAAFWVPMAVRAWSPISAQRKIAYFVLGTDEKFGRVSGFPPPRRRSPLLSCWNSTRSRLVRFCHSLVILVALGPVVAF